MDYKKAIEEIILRRKNDLLKAEADILSALRENDLLHKLDTQVRSLLMTKRRGESIDEEALLQLTSKRDKMLAQLGLSGTPAPRCNKCGDTGRADGKVCSCVISMVAATDTPEYTFEDSDLSVFAKNDRDRMEKAYAAMLGFCDKFPNTNIKNLLLLGKTGTGKSYLASCVANRLESKGYSVLFISAFGFLNRCLKYHTAPMDEKLSYLSPLLDCDLLIIDDLGTESMLKNVTVEYLYSVFSERIRLKKHIMITTNLDQESLASRYGERVYSRMCDKRLSMWAVLAESDVRKT